MAKKETSTVDALADQISELSLLEASELVSMLEEKLGVSAAAPSQRSAHSRGASAS